MSSMTAKCPMYYYGKGKMIKCGQRAQERHDFSTKEEAKAHRKKYCDTMDYEKCPYYKELLRR
jgi:hypothetical protein